MAQGGWAHVPVARLRYRYRVRLYGAAHGVAPQLESASNQNRIRPMPVAQCILDELQPRHQRRPKDHGHHRVDAVHGHHQDQRLRTPAVVAGIPARPGVQGLCVGQSGLRLNHGRRHRRRWLANHPDPRS